MLKHVKVEKVDETLGLVFGWAIVCSEGGEEYFDLQDESVSEKAMMKGACDFMQAGPVALEMHEGDISGRYVFMFPVTEDTKKAFGLKCDRTGLMVALKPSATCLEKFLDGTYTGFSIGGKVESFTEV